MRHRLLKEGTHPGLAAADTMVLVRETIRALSVRHGLHAIAVDEQREDFVPTLWDPDPRITQVLFPGAHSDVGVLSGAGSDQIDAAGGNAVPPPPQQFGRGFGRVPVYHRDSPLLAIRARAPHAKVQFDPGTDPAAAAKLAASADVAPPTA